jgi:hypothetical protein
MMQMAGRAEPSFCSEYLKDKQEEHSGETAAKDEEILKAAAASLYSGGAETVRPSTKLGSTHRP